MSLAETLKAIEQKLLDQSLSLEEARELEIPQSEIVDPNSAEGREAVADTKQFLDTKE